MKKNCTFKDILHLRKIPDTVRELICATQTVIGHWSPISFRSVIDPSNRSNQPVIWSHDHRGVTVFYCFCCFLCQFYTYLHNATDLNISLYFNFKLLLFQTDHPSFYITKLQSDRLSVINPSVINPSAVINLSNHCVDCT